MLGAKIFLNEKSPHGFPHGLTESRKVFIRLGLGNCRLVFLQHAVLDVFPQLAGDREYEASEVFALVERVIWETYKHAVFPIHDSQAANLDLVVEHD